MTPLPPLPAIATDTLSGVAPGVAAAPRAGDSAVNEVSTQCTPSGSTVGVNGELTLRTLNQIKDLKEIGPQNA
jgi:hypothetical protein